MTANNKKTRIILSSRKKTIAKVPKFHFWFYLCSMFVGLGFIYLTFTLTDEWQAIMASACFTVLVSAVFGYVIVLATTMAEERKKDEIRDYHLKNIVFYFMLYTETFMKDTFKIFMDIFPEFEEEKNYKTSVQNFLDKGRPMFANYQDAIRLQKQEGKKLLERALAVIENTKYKLKYIEKTIDDLLVQDFFAVRNYYSGDEIKTLEEVNAFLKAAQEKSLTDSFETFSYLLVNLAPIAGSGNILNLNFYYSANFKGLDYFKDRKSFIEKTKNVDFKAFVEVFQNTYEKLNTENK